MKNSILLLGLLLPLGVRNVQAETNLPEKITFADNIASLVHTKCTSCHRPGQSGPFSLITYKDVKKRAATIQAVANSRYMPPWHPQPGHFEYANARRLNDRQLAMLNRWVDGGCPEGDPQKTPPPPTFPDGWQLGKPDLVVTMADSFEVPADGPDVYRSFVFRVGLPEDKWVKAVELRPQARSAMHHAIFFLDNTGTARKIDGRDGKPGIKGMGFRITGGLGGYVPGTTPTRFPDDLALPMTKGSDIVMQTHFHPSGKPELEQATIALYFADEPPEKQIIPIQVPPLFGRGMGINIPAGEKDYVIEDTFTIPVDVEAISIGGHAHYICRQMKMTATFPNGEEKTLLDINDWDLNWQDRYFFEERARLPAKTVLKTKLTYDNSGDNPENPFDPPRRIKWGRTSNDEMGSVTLMVVAAEKNGQTALRWASRKNALRGFSSVGSRLGRERPAEDPIPKPDELPRLVKLLDRNGDGKIQKSEKPRRMSDKLFAQLDNDGNEALDASELQVLRRLLERRLQNQSESSNNKK